MEKLDLKKQLKHLYLPSAKEPVIVDVPAMKFLMVDGAIEAGMEPATSPSFAAAMQALYGAAYTLKFMSKKRVEHPVDFTVMALEGLWWVEDGEFDIRRKDNWRWRLLIMQPDHIGEAMFTEALEVLRKKKEGPNVENLRFEPFAEGRCVQIMHIGPYSEEPATVDRMRDYAQAAGYRFVNRHHEIYLGDPRRGDPAKLKTVLRHSITRS